MEYTLHRTRISLVLTARWVLVDKLYIIMLLVGKQMLKTAYALNYFYFSYYDLLNLYEGL